MIAYPAMLDVPRELAWFLASLLADHRRELGTCPGARALSCFKQAVSALVWFREKRSIPLTGKGFGISQATSYRYLDEAIDVLAVCAPDLHDVLRRVAAEGWSHVILDGNIVDSDRCAEKTLNTHGDIVDAWYAGKTHDFGGNVQAVMRPDGCPSGSRRSHQDRHTT